MTCCSTSCILRLQFLDDGFRLTLGTTLAVESGTEGIDDAAQISHQVFGAILGEVDHLNGSSLPSQECFQIAKAETGEPIFLFHDNESKTWIFQHSQQFRTAVI